MEKIYIIMILTIVLSMVFDSASLPTGRQETSCALFCYFFAQAEKVNGHDPTISWRRPALLYLTGCIRD